MNLSPRLTRWVFIAGVVMIIVSLALSIFSTATVLSAPLKSSVSVPSTVGFEGFLANSTGQAIADGAYSLTFRIYSGSSGGSALWTETLNPVQVTNGLYSVVLGANTAFSSNTFDGTRYIGVSVSTSAEIAPRTLVSSVPFALNADNANKIGGGGTANLVAAFDGACPSGWTEFAAAQGRVIVGVPTNGTLDGTIGVAFTDKENRSHSHSLPNHTHPLTVSHTNGSLGGGGISDWNNQTATGSGGAGTSGTAYTSDVIPYIQLRYCKLNP